MSDLDGDIVFEEVSLGTWLDNSKNSGGSGVSSSLSPILQTLITTGPPSPRGRRFDEFSKIVNDWLSRSPSYDLSMEVLDMKRFYTTLCSAVTVFDLTYAYIGCVGCEILAEYFRAKGSSNQVREMLLDCNDIGDDGVAVLFDKFQPDDLEVLSLEVNKLSNCGASIAALLSKAKRLKRTSFSNNPLKDDTFKEITSALCRNPTVASVAFSNVSITVNSAASISQLMTSAPSLTALNITSNDLGLPGIECIAAALQNGSKLRECNFCNVGMNAISAGKLAQSLKSNRNIFRLIVGPNNIGDKGAALFAEALAVNTTIAVVDFRKCGLSDEGVQSIINAILSNQRSAVRSLHVDYNKVTDAGILSLRSLTTLRNIRVTCELQKEIVSKAIPNRPPPTSIYQKGLANSATSNNPLAASPILTAAAPPVRPEPLRPSEPYTRNTAAAANVHEGAAVGMSSGPPTLAPKKTASKCACLVS